MNEELQKLIHDIDDWRKIKRSANAPKDKRIPEEFWNRAVVLQKKYPHMKIKEKCGFNAYSWKKRIGNKVERAPLKLIEIPSSILPDRRTSEKLISDEFKKCHLEIAFDSGIIVRIWK